MKHWFKFRLVYLAIIGIVATISSCQKEEGEGGKASIRGKIFAKYYNKTFTTLIGTGYAPEKDVYIIYGNDISYGDRVRSNYDGSYEFKYLREGNYKVYVYSKDSSQVEPSGVFAVIANVKISSKKQEVDVPDLVIFEN